MQKISRKKIFKVKTNYLRHDPLTEKESFILLIYEIMLKSIATARSECTAKQQNKASYNTCYIVLDLIDFFGED